MRSALRLGIVLAVVAAAGCRPAPRVSPRTPERGGDAVRVGLAVGVQEAVLVARGAWRGTSDDGTWTLYDGMALGLRADGGQVVGREPASEHRGEIRLEPGDGDAALLFVGVPYRGRFHIRADGGALTIVETLPIETYLRGVVPWEIGWLDADLHAAMEAQAIAARTYTCTRLGQFATFDVYADERDQVYKGEVRTSDVVDRALRSTHGQVLRYDGDLIQAYYSSTCGGHTSWVERVWPKPAAPYLRGQRDAGSDGVSYCAASPHFRWTEAWSGAALERTLRETVPGLLRWPANRTLGPLVDLRIAARDESGRVLDLDVVTSGEVVRLHGDPIRWALRPAGRPLLRSLMFDLEIERNSSAVTRVVARGGGNGHGVGMCQTGALAMARRGADATTILAHYYPGARLARAY
jgi:stage II sporulation protein D